MDVVAPLPTQDLAAAASAARSGDPRKAEAVAKGFESIFFALICKQMRETLEPGTMFGEDQGDVMGGLFDQFMGDHLAQAGSLGIAAMVRKQLAKTNQEQHHDPHSIRCPRAAGT